MWGAPVWALLSFLAPLTLEPAPPFKLSAMVDDTSSEPPLHAGEVGPGERAGLLETLRPLNTDNPRSGKAEIR